VAFSPLYMTVFGHFPGLRFKKVEWERGAAMEVRAHMLKTLFLFVLAACVPGTQAPTELQKRNGEGGAPFTEAGFSGGTGESGSYGGGPGGPAGDGGYVAPTSLLFCGETGQIVLKKNQGTLLTWSFPDGYVPSGALQFTLESTPSGIEPLGSVTPQTVLSAWFQAPAVIANEFTVSVRATLADSTTPAVCLIRLVPDEDIGIEDDGTTRGVVGNVYVLPVNQPHLPDFSQLTPVSSILVPNFDVPQRAFSMGFPGVPDLFEWFGIRFEGRLVVPESGTYEMRMTSDDGSILWIDGTKVIDNDGVHAPVTVTQSVSLTAGNHPFRLDYYQGPRYLIALELFWKKPGDSSFVIVPPDNFLRPL